MPRLRQILHWRVCYPGYCELLPCSVVIQWNRFYILETLYELSCGCVVFGCALVCTWCVPNTWSHSCVERSPQSQVLDAVKQVFFKDLSVFDSLHLSLPPPCFSARYGVNVMSGARSCSELFDAVWQTQRKPLHVFLLKVNRAFKFIYKDHRYLPPPDWTRLIQESAGTK